MNKFRKAYNIPPDDADPVRTKSTAADFDDDDDEFFKPRSTSSTVNSSVTKKGFGTVTESRDTSIFEVNDSMPTQGLVLGRVSTRTLFAQKDWQELFWVIDHDCLFLYRSKDDYESSRNGSKAKRKIPITQSLRPLKIKTKEYDIGILHNFMLEEIKDYGPSNIAKFAHSDREPVETLFLQLRNRIQQKRKSTVKSR